MITVLLFTVDMQQEMLLMFLQPLSVFIFKLVILKWIHSIELLNLRPLHERVQANSIHILVRYRIFK